MRIRLHEACAALAGALLIIAVGASGTPAHAQTIEGRVLDADGPPLVGAHVLLTELGRGTATDTDGAFRLESVSPGTYQLRVQHVGYAPATRTVTLAADRVVTITVELVPAPLDIDEVVVRAGRSIEEQLTRARQSVATLSPEMLDRTRGQTLGETLKQLPGITTMQTGP